MQHSSTTIASAHENIPPRHYNITAISNTEKENTAGIVRVLVENDIDVLTRSLFCTIVQKVYF